MKELLSRVSESTIEAWAQTFISTPSEQTALFEADPAVQGFISNVVGPLLCSVGHESRRDAMGNLIVEAGPRDSQRSFLLFTYVMTHPANTMSDAFSATIQEEENGRTIRGRGAAEQKGALASAIAAFVAASASNRDCHIVLAVSTAGETGQHKAAKSILSELPHVPKLGIVAIGTGGRICAANKGRVDVHVEVTGTSAHSSTPWAGVDAIAGARAVMDRLDRIDLRGKTHPLLGASTLTPTSIRSFPDATHTVQDRVTLTYDRRLLPDEFADQALLEIQDALREVKPWRVTAHAGAIQLPAELPLNGLLLPSARAGCARMGLEAPQTFASHGCVDAGFLMQNGCEAAMWGPGSQSMWHTADERIAVRDIVNMAGAYFGTLQAYASTSSDCGTKLE